MVNHVDVVRLHSRDLRADRNAVSPSALGDVAEHHETPLPPGSPGHPDGSSPHGLSGATLAAVAALAGVAALALGTSAFVAELRSSDRPLAGSERAQIAPTRAAVLLARPTTERIPLAGSTGSMVLAVGARGRAMLVLDGATPAPEAKSYQAWLIRPDGKVVDSLGVFSGHEVLVPLELPVRPGAGVGVTLEHADGVRAPTQKIRLAARRTR